jgi:PhnB protein
MGTDLGCENGLVRGNSMSLCLHCSSEEELKKTYDALAEGGEKTHPPMQTFWSALFGDLKDKYGNRWMLNYDKNAANN